MRLPVPKLAINALSNYLGMAIAGVASLVLTPVLLHRLQPVNYAVLAFAIAVLAVFEMLDSGAVTVLIRAISRHVEFGEFIEARALVSTGFWVALLAGAGLMSAVIAFRAGMVRAFHVSTSSASAPLVLAILVSALPLQLAGSVLRAALEGIQGYVRLNAAESAFQAARLLLFLSVVFAGFGLTGIALVFPAAALLRMLGLLLACHTAPIRISPSLWHIRPARLRELGGLATAMFLRDVAAHLFLQADTFLVARLLPLPALAMLTVARRLPMWLPCLCGPGLWVAYPGVSASVAREDRQHLREYLVASSTYVLVAIIPMAVVLYFWAGEILRWWIGPEMAGGVAVFCAMLLLSVGLAFEASPLLVLLALGEMRFTLAVSLIALFIGVPAAAFAASRYGLLGLALALGIVQAAATASLLCKSLYCSGLKMRDWLRSAAFPVVAATAPAAAAVALVHHLLPFSLVGLTLSVAAGATLFWPAYLAVRRLSAVDVIPSERSESRDNAADYLTGAAAPRSNSAYEPALPVPASDL